MYIGVCVCVFACACVYIVVSVTVFPELCDNSLELLSISRKNLRTDLPHGDTRIRKVTFLTPSGRLTYNNPI